LSLVIVAARVAAFAAALRVVVVIVPTEDGEGSVPITQD
jgi:hypothetical protein